MKKFIFILLFSSGLLQAQEKSQFFNSADEFFKTYVENGKVKYAEIKQNPKLLNKLLGQAKKYKVSPEEFKAFWINAHNLAVIDGIVKNYPLDSPLDIDGFLDVKKHSLGLQSVTLDEVEHQILFENFPDEKRFHLFLVCAARGLSTINF